jgi:hypothetical protein
MNAAFRAGSDGMAHPLIIVQREITMLRQQRLARKFVARQPQRDMALASTIVFFGVFPAVLGAALVLTQLILAFAH